MKLRIRITASRTCAARHLRESSEIGFEETAAAFSWRSGQRPACPEMRLLGWCNPPPERRPTAFTLITVIRRRNFVRIPPIRATQPLGRYRSGRYLPLEAAA